VDGTTLQGRCEERDLDCVLEDTSVTCKFVEETAGAEGSGVYMYRNLEQQGRGGRQPQEVGEADKKEEVKAEQELDGYGYASSELDAEEETSQLLARANLPLVGGWLISHVTQLALYHRLVRRLVWVKLPFYRLGNKNRREIGMVRIDLRSFCVVSDSTAPMS